MSMLKPLGAAAMLTAIGFTPAPAQQVMSEPGYCAQFYPNANGCGAPRVGFTIRCCDRGKPVGAVEQGELSYLA